MISWLDECLIGGVWRRQCQESPWYQATLHETLMVLFFCFRLLAAYNSLTDKHLAGYFNNTRIRRHLLRSGLVRFAILSTYLLVSLNPIIPKLFQVSSLCLSVRSFFPTYFRKITSFLKLWFIYLRLYVKMRREVTVTSEET
jgi:hypothetical protein